MRDLFQYFHHLESVPQYRLSSKLDAQLMVWDSLYRDYLGVFDYDRFKNLVGCRSTKLDFKLMLQGSQHIDAIRYIMMVGCIHYWCHWLVLNQQAVLMPCVSDLSRLDTSRYQFAESALKIR